MSEGRAGLRGFRHVGHGEAETGLGSFVRFFGLGNLDFARPHVGPREHDPPVRLDDAADQFLQAVAQLKERSLGVDTCQDDRHAIGEHAGATQ